MATANPTDKSTFHKVSDSMAEKVANLTRTFQAMERSSKESSEKPKSELLKMVATGKGIGYVALKNIKIGTLILDEKPQIFTEGTAPESKFFKSLSESFKNLQLDDQEKYLKLYNRFEKTDLLKEISNIQTSGGGWTTSRGVIGEENPFIKDKNQKSPFWKIYGIFKTNSLTDMEMKRDRSCQTAKGRACSRRDLGLEVSRFNHSCSANALIAWKEETQSYQIRTVSKIEAGEEICINYLCGKSMFMKNARTRQRRLLVDWGFECECSLCLYENANLITSHNLYEKFATLEAHAKSLTDANTTEEVLYFQKGKPIDIDKYLENTYGRVLCYKEMYKIAQEKKPVRTHLMDFMATGLVAISNAGARAEDEKVESWASIFMDEGALFLNVISKLYKIIHGCTTEEWIRIQPKFLWEKNEEDQNRRLLSSGYYRTDDCDSDSE